MKAKASPRKKIKNNVIAFPRQRRRKSAPKKKARWITYLDFRTPWVVRLVLVAAILLLSMVI